MSEALQCPSCGGSNQLPEGKNSMFCAFCGNAIDKKVDPQKENQESNIKTKPTITPPGIKQISTAPPIIFSEIHRERVDGGWSVTDRMMGTSFYRDKTIEIGGGELRLTEKSLKKLKEVIDWFTDSELESVSLLDLSHNKIIDLKGIEKFKNIEILNLSNNQIKSIKDIKKFDNLYDLNLANNKIESIENFFENNRDSDELDNDEKEVIIDLSYNNINSISENSIDQLKILAISSGDGLNLILNENPIVDSDKIKVFNLLNKQLTSVQLEHCNSFWFQTMVKYLSDSFEDDYNPKIAQKSFLEWLNEFERDYKTDPNIVCNIWISYKNEIQEEGQQDGETYSIFYPPITTVKKALQNVTGYNPDKVTKSYCFIATATMGSYDHPQVMELRHFRDNWILAKNWGDSFVKWYYHYGEKAAKVIDKSFILKKLSYLLIVKPLVYLSRIVKK